MKTKERSVLDRIINDMISDNEVIRGLTQYEVEQALVGVASMMEAGCEFTTEEVELVAMGEESEREYYFTRFSGYNILDQMLATAFDGNTPEEPIVTRTGRGAR